VRTEDGRIIQRCLNGEPEAFGLLVDKYKAGIYAFVYAKLRDFHDAQDVTQEVFIKAYRDLRSLRQWESFVFWLYRIASSHCGKWLRARSRRPDQEFIEDQAPKTLEDRSIDSYRQNQADESLYEALYSLPEAYREVLTLYYFAGMNSQDIARALGMSPTAIRKRLSRARAQLREEMAVMMGTALERQKLQASFTFRIVEAVKRIKIDPTPRATALPWGLSLAAGIIITVMSLSPQISLQNPTSRLTGSPLPAEMKVLETGEIPVNVLKISQIPIAADGQYSQGYGHSRESVPPEPENVPLMAPRGGENTFKNVAREAGLWEVKRLKSLTPVWGDYDNDGDLDLYVTHGGWQNLEMEADVFYRNNGDGTFTDVTAEAGLDKNNGDGKHAGFLDYDNDGYMDLYVSDWNWEDDDGGRIILYHNNGDGTFTDETRDAGIEDMVHNYSWSSTFADFDNDGDLDIYVAVGWGSNIFYENEGDGQFTDATKKAGLGDTGGALNMASGDYDNDGDVDIFVSNATGLGNEPVVFYRNNADGTFTDVAKEAGVSEERNGRAVAFFDYDNDGDLDICVGGVTGTPTRLYRNNGDGTFTDVTRESGVSPGSAERLTVGDYDNDGYMDVFTMNSRNKLYHNNGDGTFTEVAGEARVSASPGLGGCSFADYDGDGDLDLYVLSLRGYDALYRNDGNDNHWLQIRLVGTETNRDGVGARVVVKAGELSMTREINPGCGGSRHSLTAHFGLGKNTQADSVEIRWPSGPVIGEGGKAVPGRIEVFENVPADRFIMIEEGSGKIVEVKIAGAVQPQGKLSNTWGKVKVSKLHQNFPNPFNPETWIPFSLSEPEHVIIRIYTSAGQLVRTLDLGKKPSGAYLSKGKAAHWDGKNEAGEKLSSGVYFYTIQAGEFAATKKMTIAE
jgi:RNA polymerase sigma factor (sigma-70 family)